jgi:FkbM family methyltransferase
LNTFQKHVKHLLERLSGWDIEHLCSKSFTVVKKNHRKDAWFSSVLQARSIIETYGIDLVIDVGANEGQFAQSMRSFYRGEILSFEPVSCVYAKLVATAAADPHWHVHQLALGSQESTQTINVSNQTVFSSMLKVNDYCTQYFGVSPEVKQEVVSVRRLDTLLNELIPNIQSRRIFVKMDTQGQDVEVFKGLRNRLDQVIAMQSEVSLIPIYEGMPHWIENISVYEEAGFGVVGMFPVRRDSYKVIEYDCLLIKE